MSVPAPTTLWTQIPHAGYFINSVAVSASGHRVAAGTYFHVYGSASAAASRSPVPAPQAGSADPSETGTFGTYVWDAAGNPLLSQTFDGWQGAYWVALSGDGKTVASSGWYQNKPTVQGYVAAYDIDSGTQLLMFNPGVRGNMVCLNADGSLLMAGFDQGYLFHRTGAGVFVTTPAKITLSGAGDEVMVAALDASGGTGLIVSYHGEVILFSIVAGAVGVLQRWQTPHSAYVHAAALSADGTHAYVGANDGTLYAFNVAQFLQQPAQSWSTPIPGGATTIYGVICNGNGSLVGVGGNVSDGSGVVAVYGNKYREGALLWHTTTAHSPNGLSMDLAGNYLAAADGHDTGGDFTLWQPLLNSELWTCTTSAMSWPIQISADANMVVAGSDDGSVYVYAGPRYGG